MLSKKVVDLVERLESIVKAFFEVKHMDGVRVESYRQDAPTVEAFWTGPEDGLSRNIILLVRDSNGECYVDFEENVWFDDSVLGKRHWVRKPAGRTASTLWMEPYTGEQLPVLMGIILEKTLERVLKIQGVHLINTSDLR